MFLSNFIYARTVHFYDLLVINRADFIKRIVIEKGSTPILVLFSMQCLFVCLFLFNFV